MKGTGWIRLERGKAFITNSEVFQFLKRGLPKWGDELVEYWSPESQKFCVGRWRNRIGGWVTELTSYKNPQDVQPDILGFLRYYLSNRQISDSKMLVRYQLDRERHALEVMDQRRQQQAEWKRHRERKRNHARRGNPIHEALPAVKPKGSQEPRIGRV